MFLGTFILEENLVREVMEVLGCLEGVRLCEGITYIWLWELQHTGLFSCKLFFKFLINSHYFRTFKFCLFISKGSVPIKVQVFSLLLASSKPNTQDMLKRRKRCLHLSPGWCVLCWRYCETVNHLFLHCPFSSSIWH